MRDASFGEPIVVEAERSEEPAVEVATEIVVAPVTTMLRKGGTAFIGPGRFLQQGGMSHTDAIRDVVRAPASPGRAGR